MMNIKKQKHIIHRLEQERDKLNEKLNQAYELGYKTEGKLHDMTNQRDTLIDDLTVLRANNKRLENENKRLKRGLQGSY